MEPNPPFPHIDMKPKSTPWRFLFLIIGIALIVGGSFFVIGQAPADFVPGTQVKVPEGSSVRDTGDLLYEKEVIRSSSLFQFIVKMAFHDRPVIAGDFAFEKKYNVYEVARMLTGGGFGGTQVRITIPEGSSVVEIAAIMSKSIPGWNANEFVSKAKPFEGGLFPETYIVFKSITADDLIAQLKKEYASKTKNLKDEIKKSGYSESQIIIMASLLEKEAKNESEAKVISGILWKRLKQGKLLQVDAPFLYALKKTSAQLTRQDLQKDGPYNTYTRKGLPATAIGNPGMTMILAALRPESSNYWFYLHGNDGVIRYAKTYEEHLINKKKYLK
jgi:UPF0755 protein